MPARIYLDHAATTPMVLSARAAMIDAQDCWANPSSPHAEGRAARAALEAARIRIGDLLGWPGAILFTSGATEAIGIVMTRAGAGGRVISVTEHDAVRRWDEGAAMLPVEADGRVSAVRLAEAIEQAGRAPVVAVQLVNSETGVIQSAEAIGAAIRAAGGLWLCDATQAVGKIDLPDADFIAFSAHKFGGPPGVGALLVRDLATLAPTGGQEQGYRGGTENLPAIAGMAAALGEGRGWLMQAAKLRSELDEVIDAAGGEIVARDTLRLPTIAAYRMPRMPAAAQLIRFDSAGFAISAGSACSSGSLRTSHVLAAMGLDGEAAGEVIRVSFGRTTQPDEVARFADQWRAIAGDTRPRVA